MFYIFVRCNILIRHHFLAHMMDVQTWNTHFCVPPLSCSTSFSIYCTIQESYRNGACGTICTCVGGGTSYKLVRILHIDIFEVMINRSDLALLFKICFFFFKNYEHTVSMNDGFIVNIPKGEIPLLLSICLRNIVI